MPFCLIVCFLVIYISILIVGGFLFHATECPNEKAVKRRDAEDERDLREYMTIIYSHLENCNKVFEHGEEELALMKVIKTKISTITTKEEDFECKRWSMYNSIFFSFTIITTIGYGKVTPQTQLGRGTCFFYTIIGVPINCILITFIGNFIKEKVSELCL